MTHSTRVEEVVQVHDDNCPTHLVVRRGESSSERSWCIALRFCELVELAGRELIASARPGRSCARRRA